MVRKYLTSIIRGLDVSDMDRLYFLNLLHGQRLVDLHDMVQRRVELTRNIRKCDENGYVGLVFVTLDRGGVPYEDQKSKIPTSKVFEELAMTCANAKGPLHWYICPVSELYSARPERYVLRSSVFETAAQQLVS